MDEKIEKSRLNDESVIDKRWEIDVGLSELQLRARCAPVAETTEASNKPYIQEYFQDGAGI